MYKIKLCNLSVGYRHLHEDITQDPDGSHGRWNVQSHESRETDCLSELFDLHDVILRLEVVVLATEDEGNGGELRDGAAVDDVLATDNWSSTENLKKIVSYFTELTIFYSFWVTNYIELNVFLVFAVLNSVFSK